MDHKGQKETSTEAESLHEYGGDVALEVVSDDAVDSDEIFLRKSGNDASVGYMVDEYLPNKQVTFRG